jgi:prepilin-type processing-associated H-X9-DG protein/prepilin-type N-terminal cleavage/methylation domain-containing protein
MRSHYQHISSRCPAFTLVELLSVLAVIAILAGIAIPVVGQIQLAGKKTECLSNMRQIGLGLQLYANENNGNLPETTHTQQLDESWIFTLAPYLGDVDEVRICPADPKRRERLEAGGSSYTLNSFLFVPKYGPFGELIEPALNNFLRIPEPERTYMAFNISDSAAVGASNDHTHSDRWTDWNAVLADIEPNCFRLGNSNADHTNGSANYLFADGHVENIDARDMKALIDSGENFAEPPGVE